MPQQQTIQIVVPEAPMTARAKLAPVAPASAIGQTHRVVTTPLQIPGIPRKMGKPPPVGMQNAILPGEGNVTMASLAGRARLTDPRRSRPTGSVATTGGNDAGPRICPTYGRRWSAASCCTTRCRATSCIGLVWQVAIVEAEQHHQQQQ